MTHVISQPFIKQGMNIFYLLNIDWLRKPIDKLGQTIGCGNSVKACLTLWPLLLWPFVVWPFDIVAKGHIRLKVTRISPLKGNSGRPDRRFYQV